MPSVIGWWHNSLGWVAVAEHDYPLACAEFALAADFARADEGGEWLAPHALAALGPLTIAAGDSEQGVRLAEEGLMRARQPRLRAILIMALTSAAETAILAGNRDRAQELLEELVRALRDQASLRWAADALELAGVFLEGEQPATAADALALAAALRGDASHVGGIRPVAAEVQRTQQRLVAALGADRLTRHGTEPTTQSMHAVINDILIGLEHREGSVAGP